MLLDRFLDDAIEVDVDAVCDGEDVLIGGIMEHIEQAGVHSGDSSCSLPPNSLSAELQDELRAQTRKLARALNVVGLMNVQFAIQNGTVYVLEVNPRASRTVPFVSKATGVPLAKIAARVMTGRKLARAGRARASACRSYYSVKEAVFPFVKFPGGRSDPRPGDEIHRRGHGHGPHLRRGLCQVAGRLGRGAAALGLLPDQRARARQGGRGAAGAAADRARLHAGRHHAARPRRSRPPASSAGASTRCARAGRTSST